MKKVVKVLAGTMVLSLMACSEGSKTSGVTEDENAVAHNDSSSSTTSVSSSSKDPKSSGSSMLELWNGTKGAARVNVGIGNAGYWFNVADGWQGGNSKVLYPIDMDGDMSEEDYGQVVSYCEGLCATIELEGSSLPVAGVGFTVAEDGAVSDLSEWGGLCVTYASDFAMNVLLSGNAAGDTLNLESPFVTLPKTIKNVPTLDQLIGSDKVVTRCAKWGDFEAPAWSEAAISGEEAAKMMRSVVFVYRSNSDERGMFNIVKVGKYDGKLPQWSEPVNVTDFAPSSSSGNTNDDPSCLWNGATDGIKVNTGFGDGSEENGAGYWYTYDNNDDGGLSFIQWPIECTMTMDDSECLAGKVDYCGGLCGKMIVNKGNAREALIGMGFNLAGLEPGGTVSEAVDISDWGGICVTYYSSIGMDLVLGIDSVTKVTYELDKSTELVETCLTWNDFDDGENEIPGAEAAKKVRNIKFEQFSGESMTGDFNIVAIGKYSETGTCRTGN